MITKVKACGSFGPRRNYPYPSSFDYIGHEDQITSRQQRTLTSLIYQNIQGEDDRENWLRTISDLTSEEAEELIFDFSLGWCR